MAELNGWMTIPDCFAATVFAGCGFDSVTIDMQHALFDEASTIAVLMTLGQIQPLRYVRVPSCEAALIGKMLDAGADGIIVPMINSQSEALALAGACRYPPSGRRSFGPIVTVRRTIKPTPPSIFAMIETRAAFEAVDEILAVDGIDGVFVGPNDLGLALGYGAGSDREEPEMRDALSRIAAAARQKGKRAGLFCLSPAYAQRIEADGYDLLTISVDKVILEQGAQAAVRALRVT